MRNSRTKLNIRRRARRAASLLAILPALCHAGAFELPSALTTVEEDAFSGIPVIREITLPAGLETEFTEAFPETDETLWVHAAQGQQARLLLTSGLDVDAGTKRRALIISQTYPESEKKLEGPASDAAAMKNMLTHLERTGFEVTIRSNVSAEGILSAIRSAFSGAAEYDISLFYYSGHGLYGGSLVGCEEGTLAGTVSPSELRGALDGIPGRKVLIVDACYSGGLLEEDDEEAGESSEAETLTKLSAGMGTMSLQSVSVMEIKSGGLENGSADDSGTIEGEKESINKESTGSESLEGSQSGEIAADDSAEPEEETAEGLSPTDFTAGFLSAFSGVSTGRRRIQSVSQGSAYSAYYIMTAATVWEESYEGTFTVGESSGKMGLFTYYLCKGCGWNGITGSVTTKTADANSDGLVTFGEAFTYAANNARTEAKKNNKSQNAQSNAASMQSFSPFR